MDREAFLAGVAAAVRRGPSRDPGRPTAFARGVEQADPDTFARALEAAGGRFHGELSPTDAAVLAARLARGTGSPSFLAWGKSHLPAPGVIGAVESAGLTRAAEVVPTDPAGRRSHQMAYLPIGFGLTGSDALLADTGSIVLASGEGKPRMASLIPEVHLALARRRDLFPSMSSWMAEIGPTGAGVTGWTIVTGPSRTADIEQVLTRGVHGPREVHVAFVTVDAH